LAAKGAQGGGGNQHVLRSHDETAPTLADLGVSKTQSSLWQKRAAGPVGGTWRSRRRSRRVATDHPEFRSAECSAHAETCEHAARFLSGPDELQRVLLEIAALWRKRARDLAALSKA
jgi:hypothetical protein